MTTNYYAVNTETGEELHIGKKSYGWCFALHVIPEQNLNNLDDWIDILNGTYYEIINEYGDLLSLSQLLNIIVNEPDDLCESQFVLHGSEEKFHETHYSMRYNSKLVRARIDNNFCIGHGAGPYDYVIGNFS